MTKLGNSAKDSQYLKRIKDAIADDREHPRHHGVKMQAHHMISAEGMRLSGLAKKIEKLGYDINLLPNLAFIPCTLQGACHLGVQPHRGNHTATVDQDDYDDDKEPKDYHGMVSRLLRRLELPIEKVCSANEFEKAKEKLNELSEDILDMIQYKPGEAPLTTIAKHFKHGEHVGCGNVDSVPRHSASRSCAVERNHLNRQAPGQTEEEISFQVKGKFKLKPGR